MTLEHVCIEVLPREQAARGIKDHRDAPVSCLGDGAATGLRNQHICHIHEAGDLVHKEIVCALTVASPPAGFPRHLDGHPSVRASKAGAPPRWHGLQLALKARGEVAVVRHDGDHVQRLLPGLGVRQLSGPVDRLAFAPRHHQQNPRAAPDPAPRPLRVALRGSGHGSQEGRPDAVAGQEGLALEERPDRWPHLGQVERHSDPQVGVGRPLPEDVPHLRVGVRCQVHDGQPAKLVAELRDLPEVHVVDRDDEVGRCPEQDAAHQLLLRRVAGPGRAPRRARAGEARPVSTEPAAEVLESLVEGLQLVDLVAEDDLVEDVRHVPVGVDEAPYPVPQGISLVVLPVFARVCHDDVVLWKICLESTCCDPMTSPK
mmetsp:Transcript_12856/g.36560  ORF Transcript_12856/g.36560 Transcript_12856/m.36560 type:complete len:372 (-) Transcript_12856:1443-2558(-)